MMINHNLILKLSFIKADKTCFFLLIKNLNYVSQFLNFLWTKMTPNNFYIYNEPNIKAKTPFSSRKFSTISKIQNMKIFNVF